jgi:hypothetical protein
MLTINKEANIELSTGTTIDVEIEIFGIYDSQFGADADGNRGEGRWLVDSHGYSVSDNVSLTSEEEDELDEKIEELVYEADHDWTLAAEEQGDEDHEDFF